MTAQTKKTRIDKVIFSVIGVITAAKLLGFVKQIFVSGAFGATLDTDIINIAQTVIGDLEYLLSHVLMTSFITVYLNASAEDGRGALFAENAVRAFLLLSAGASVLFLAGAYPLSRLLAPSYSPQDTARLARYLRIYTPLLLLFAMSAASQALLSANKRFAAVEARGITQSVIIIAAIALLGGRLGADALVVGSILCTAVNTVWFYLLSARYLRAPGVALPDSPPRRPFDCFRDPLVRRLIGMSGPLLAGYSAYYVGQQINKSLASGLGAGAVTELGCGTVLFNLVTAFITAFCSIMFSYVTAKIACGSHLSAARTANLTAVLLIAVFMPVSVIAGVLAPDISRIAFGRGQFSDKNVASTAMALAGYSLSFIPFAVGEVYGRVQYGYGDARRPMLNSVTSIVCGIVLSILLSRRLGVAGITLSYSISAFVVGGLNLMTSQRHNRALSLRPLLPFLPFLAIGGACCFGAVCRCRELLSGSSPILRFLASGVAGLGIYCAVLALGAALMLRRFGGKGSVKEKIRRCADGFLCTPAADQT